ncbi:MAG: alpha/beta fold hydrolase [Acidobacteria bacterium]|nr:alpha/beta fold hydrolase [Acidobacteriota bacterium]
MHLEQYGTGSEIYVGLHGWSGDYTTFAPLLKHLPAEVSLYSADLPGCGKSPAPVRWDLSAIAHEITEAILRLQTKVTLIGNCSGALLGLLAVSRIPNQFRRLVLIDPLAFWPWYFKVFVNPSFGKYAYYSTFANPIGRWLTNRSLKAKRTADSDLTQSFAAINHETVYRYLTLLTGIDGIAQFGGLRMPIDIVYGERTFAAVKQSAERWRSIWPQARCRELAGAGHLPIEEATAQLSELIFDRTIGSESQRVTDIHHDQGFTLERLNF